MSTGVLDLVVSVDAPMVDDEDEPDESEVFVDGVVVSESVDFSGVWQPIAAIAKNAMKRMLFMRIIF